MGVAYVITDQCFGGRAQERVRFDFRDVVDVRVDEARKQDLQKRLEAAAETKEEVERKRLGDPMKVSLSCV